MWQCIILLLLSGFGFWACAHKYEADRLSTGPNLRVPLALSAMFFLIVAMVSVAELLAG